MFFEMMQRWNEYKQTEKKKHILQEEVFNFKQKFVLKTIIDTTLCGIKQNRWKYIQICSVLQKLPMKMIEKYSKIKGKLVKYLRWYLVY